MLARKDSSNIQVFKSSWNWKNFCCFCSELCCWVLRLSWEELDPILGLWKYVLENYFVGFIIKLLYYRGSVAWEPKKKKNLVFVLHVRTLIKSSLDLLLLGIKMWLMVFECFCWVKEFDTVDSCFKGRNDYSHNEFAVEDNGKELFCVWDPKVRLWKWAFTLWTRPYQLNIWSLAPAVLLYFLSLQAWGLHP